MPKGSPELMHKRKKEVIDACEKLYQTKGFHDITIKDISKETSMSRPSIYNYYETKEEIFLALLTEEYDRWTADLHNLAESHSRMTADELSHEIAGTLKYREVLLKISAMNLYEIEENSRLNNLAEYKGAFKKSVEAFEEVLHKFLPKLSRERIEEIRYAFYPFMYGIYPYAHPTDKQIKAMDQVQLDYHISTVEEITYHFLRQIVI